MFTTNNETQMNTKTKPKAVRRSAAKLGESLERKAPLEENPAWYSKEYCQESKSKIDSSSYLELTPQEIYRMLTKHVVEQDEACKAVAIMMYMHLHGHRSVNILAGPTGSGKSFLTETLRAIFPDIVILRNIADLTCDGWKGEKKVGTLFKNIRTNPFREDKFSKFMVLDEADKCFTTKYGANGGMPSEDVQAELLSVIHGTEIVVPNSDSISSRIDTSKFSFLFAGAFERQARKIADNKSGGIGFGSKQDKVASYSETITMEDVHDAGCISELCGRIGRVIPLSKISADSYRRMLDNKKSGPVYELEKEFGIEFQISEAAKDIICDNAWSSELGVRSIMNQLRAYIDDAIWENPNPTCIEIA